MLFLYQQSINYLYLSSTYIYLFFIIYLYTYYPSIITFGNAPKTINNAVSKLSISFEYISKCYEFIIYELLFIVFLSFTSNLSS